MNTLHAKLSDTVNPIEQLNPRRLEILKHIAGNPGISLNKLFVDTSPVCQRTGRKRAFGSDGWTIPKTLQNLELIEWKTDWSKVKDRDTANQVRHTFYLTPFGRKILAKKIHNDFTDALLKLKTQYNADKLLLN